MALSLRVTHALSLWFLSFLVSLRITAAKVVTHHFNIEWISAAPDGYVRPVVAINGAFPPPIIHVTLGDELDIHTVNNLGKLLQRFTFMDYGSREVRHKMALFKSASVEFLPTKASLTDSS